MADIIILDSATNGVKAKLKSKEKGTVEQLLRVIGEGALEDSDGALMINTSSILEPGTYKWTSAQAPTQPFHQLSEKGMAGLQLMAEDCVAKKRTIVLSDATRSAKNDLMDMLHLPEKGAPWPNRPTVSRKVNGFSWLKGDEDSDENRAAYMSYLKETLQIPLGYALADAKPDTTLLSVEVLRGMPESRKISGTTDVAIAKSEHVEAKAIRNNIETLLELKKPKNLLERDHTPKTIGKHFAASYLNPDHAVVSVLTDLNENWTFFWFAIGKNKNNSKAALYKLCLDGGDAAANAKYILDSLYDDSFGDTLPTTFTNRISLQAILDSVIQHKRARREFDGNDSSSPELDSKPAPSGGTDQHPASGTDAGSSSGSHTVPYQNNQGTVVGGGGGGGAPMDMASALSLFAPPSDRDVANELDLIDMVGEIEQYEIIRSFAAKHIVPYMMQEDNLMNE